MNIAMVGVDHQTTRNEIRERLSLADDALAKAIRLLQASGAAEGYVLLCTCNRTELYVSGLRGGPTEAASLLCDLFALDMQQYRDKLVARRGREAAAHLMMVASGMHSSVLFEDQILSQVKAAADVARAHHLLDGELGALFRLAVTCGKRTRAELQFVPADGSIAEQIRHATRMVEAHVDRLETWLAGRQSAAAPPRFPIFIDLAGRRVLIVGGGRVASRRASTLLQFGADVVVVSPQLEDGLMTHMHRGDLTWIERAYRSGDVAGAALVIAATSSREVNRIVGDDARAAGIPVSVADRREECTFWFPAVVQSGDLVAGLASTSGDHALVKRTAEMFRKGRELDSANDPCGEPR